MHVYIYKYIYTCIYIYTHNIPKAPSGLAARPGGDSPYEALLFLTYVRSKLVLRSQQWPCRNVPICGQLGLMGPWVCIYMYTCIYINIWGLGYIYIHICIICIRQEKDLRTLSRFGRHGLRHPRPFAAIAKPKLDDTPGCSAVNFPKGSMYVNIAYFGAQCM